MYYEVLLGHIGLYDEGKQLHSMKEVADFREPLKIPEDIE